MVRIVEIPGVQTDRTKRLMDSLGGEFETEFGPDGVDHSYSAAVDSCRRLNVRALRVQHVPIEPFTEWKDVSWVGELADQLEVLRINTFDPKGVETWPVFPKLRSLIIADWKGRLDFGKFPALESLSICPADGFDTIRDLPKLKHLALSEYKGSDLSWLEPLELKSLEVVDCRRLESLDGIGSQRSLEYLEVGLCPKLTDISALEGLDGLKLLRIEDCNRLEDISVVQSLTGLRYLSLSDNKGIGSVATLADLKELEVVLLVGSVANLDLDPLLGLDSLRYVGFPYGRHFKKWRGELPENEDAWEDHIEFMRAATHIDPESLREDG